MNLKLKPIKAFSLAGSKAIRCQVVQGDPRDAIDHDFVYRSGDIMVPLRIVAVSTGWVSDDTFDFVYTSDLSIEEGRADPQILTLAPELQWLDEYTGQTVDELIALEGKYRIDSLVLAFEQAIDQKAARDGDDQLSDEEVLILAVEAMEREVNNGGWEQFFVNSSGEFAPTIVDALQRIGCPKTARIAQKAVNVYGKSPITEAEIENGTWEANEKRDAGLSECDNEYFECPENIEESLFAFIKANRAKIQP